MSDRWDRSLAVLLTLVALMLHAAFFVSAGGLWRDEANTIQQARLESWKDLWHSLKHDSFPVLYPALLRIWSSHFSTSGDDGLRLFGFLIGLANLASLWLVAGFFRASFPSAALAFLAINPVMIVEGDSIRPYGLSIFLVVWVFALLGKCIEEPRATWLLLAAVMAVLSVQSSYSNIVLVGICSFCAALTFHLGRRSAAGWKLFLPALCATVSLVPYLGILREIGVWGSIVYSRTDWGQIITQTAGASGNGAFLLLGSWIGVFFLAPFSFLGGLKIQERGSESHSLLVFYSSCTAVLTLVSQVAFVQIAGLAPFLRYFLFCLAVAALACEFALRERAPGLRRALVIAVLVLTAWPNWNWVRLRRTNVDVVAAYLERRTHPDDLIVISPWFLNTSFQRYYRGPAQWITVPDLLRQPMMRYDQVRLKIINGDTNTGIGTRLEQTLERDHVVWLVSQQFPLSLKIEAPPAVPGSAVSPDGGDYIRFRSYWERDIAYRLAGSSVGEIVGGLEPHRVWFEERLILSRWRRRGR